jgi:hypothetical protein
MKLTPMEEQFQYLFVACRSDIIKKMATTSATADMAVKWQLNPRKQTEFAHKGILYNFPQKPC